jgi:hypothetical protein
MHPFIRVGKQVGAFIIIKLTLMVSFVLICWGSIMTNIFTRKELVRCALRIASSKLKFNVVDYGIIKRKETLCQMIVVSVAFVFYLGQCKSCNLISNHIFILRRRRRKE